MQPLSLQETQQKILSLNSDENPCKYTVNGKQIIGDWKIADVKWAAVLRAGKIDEKYRITVNLDEASRTYTFNENKAEKMTNVGADPASNDVSFGTSKSFFSGKMTQKEFGFGAGTFVKQNGNDTGHTYKYSFDTKKIKEPLFNALEQSGWQPKKSSLLSKLFRN